MKPFWRGVLFAMFIFYAWQDYVGKEAVLEHIDSRWIEWPWFMPGVWGALALAMFIRGCSEK